MTILWNYYYFQAKDHEQLPQKAWYLAKVGFVSGTVITGLHLLYYPNFPQTATYVGSYWVRSTVPLTASLVLGSTLSGTISRLRGNKDDNYNYFFGFLPTAFIWTALFKNSGKGATAAMAMSLGAVLMKIMDKHDYQVYNTVPRGHEQYSGSFGGMDMGDVRWMTPGLLVTDPGRRPTV